MDAFRRRANFSGTLYTLILSDLIIDRHNYYTKVNKVDLSYVMATEYPLRTNTYKAERPDMCC